MSQVNQCGGGGVAHNIDDGGGGALVSVLMHSHLPYLGFLRVYVVVGVDVDALTSAW